MATDKKLSTESYKGVRDFYPEDMAIQRYIFDTWSQAAESFGFERYDASVLEPADLYRSKTSEEIVNEQTYTFVDRGEREVTLRPEMTPTVARMVAGKRRELTFPVRWYSIPNLFRYERMQKGRLREHWQLNCDIFGADHFSADVELISLAHHMLTSFGAETDMFEVRLNNRKLWDAVLDSWNISADDKPLVTRLVDRKNKMDFKEFKAEAEKIKSLAPHITPFIQALKIESLEALPSELHETDGFVEVQQVISGLKVLGITNIRFDLTLARGFDYYTGTIFEIFDTSGENNRSLLGGGRYDNLTGLFGGDSISGIGFGMGDVTMRDFLTTHELLTSDITAPTLMVIPTSLELNIDGQKIAQAFRKDGVSVAVDISSKKIGKKISDASDAFVSYVLIVGDDEIKSKHYTLKNLTQKTEVSGTLSELVKKIS